MKPVFMTLLSCAIAIPLLTLSAVAADLSPRISPAIGPAACTNHTRVKVGERCNLLLARCFDGRNAEFHRCNPNLSCSALRDNQRIKTPRAC